MLNEMMWSYSAGESAEDHYVLRKDTLDSISQSLQDVIGKEMFNSEYLNTLENREETIEEARNTLYLKVINEIQNLGLGKWAVHFMSSENDYLLLPTEKGTLKESFKLTIDKLNNYDSLKMLELKQEINNDQSYSEVLRIKDVLKRLL